MEGKITKFSEEGKEVIRQIIRQELKYQYIPCFKCKIPVKVEDNFNIVDGIGIFHKGAKYFCEDCVGGILNSYVKSKIKKRSVK